MQTPFLPAIEIDPKAPIRSSVIWLHGLGADGHDFAPVVRELALPDKLGVRFVLPHAPERPVTINGGYVMRAWYDIRQPRLDQLPDLEGIGESRQAIARLIEREAERGVPAERILLAGFSQGGVIALEAAAQQPQDVAGVIALSTYLAQPDRLPQAPRALPVFMAHGTQDTIVPYALGELSRNRLNAQGFDVEWHSYPMPHSVCGEEILAIRQWMLARLEHGAGS